MNYMSYHQFFTLMNSIIHDMSIDVKYSNYKGEMFDVIYKNFINKLIGRCDKYERETIMGESKIIKMYKDSIRATISYPQKERFDDLKEITSDFVKKCI